VSGLCISETWTSVTPGKTSGHEKKQEGRGADTAPNQIHLANRLDVGKDANTGTLVHGWRVIVLRIRETGPGGFVELVELERSVHQTNAGDLLPVDVIELGVEVLLDFRVRFGRNLIQQRFRLRTGESVVVRERRL